MPNSQRSVESVYEEIAGLTGNRAELDRQRYMLVKAIRALKAIAADAPTANGIGADAIAEFDIAIATLESKKAELWVIIERTDAGIQRLTDLVQNGAYNHESR